MRFHSVSSHRIYQKPRTYLLAAGMFVTILLIALFPGDSSSREHAIFQQFTQHIGKQIHKDKQAFARANNCVSWFYKKAKTPPPPTVQGISWNRTLASQLDIDCPRDYPGGMDEARDDFSKTQSVLSVSLTFYEFALVADRKTSRSRNVRSIFLAARASISISRSRNACSPLRISCCGSLQSWG